MSIALIDPLDSIRIENLYSPSLCTSATFCNPEYCDSRHDSEEIGQKKSMQYSMGSEKLEHYAQVIIAKERLTNLFKLVVGFEVTIGKIITTYIDSVQDSDLSTNGNKLSWRKFKLAFKKEIEKVFETMTKVQMIQFFAGYLSNLGKVFDHLGDCMAQWKELSIFQFCENKSVDLINFYEIQFCRDPSHKCGLFLINQSMMSLYSKGWSDRNIGNLTKILVKEMSWVILNRMASAPIGKWLSVLEKKMSATRLLLYAQTTRSRVTWHSPGYTEIFPFQSPLELLYDSGKLRLEQNLKKQKQAFHKKVADEYAKIKNYDGAMEFFDLINFVGTHSEHLLQSLTNAAAVRLRISIRDPGEEPSLHQIPVVILECSFALQIEPNHVKALFRRGLALALLKKWNEAIIDFERAVELDPLSPAKKELEVARRQVMKRIGN